MKRKKLEMLLVTMLLAFILVIPTFALGQNADGTYDYSGDNHQWNPHANDEPTPPVIIKVPKCSICGYESKTTICPSCTKDIAENAFLNDTLESIDNVYTQILQIQASLPYSDTLNDRIIHVVNEAESLRNTSKEIANNEKIQENENINQNITENKKNKGEVGGDPVRLSSGEYVQTETDAEIYYSGGSFSINRVYTAQKTVSGSLGYRWLFNLDSRIIRGIDSYTTETEETFNNANIKSLESDIEDVINLFKQAYNASDDWRLIPLQYNDLVIQTEAFLVQAQDIVNKAKANTADKKGGPFYTEAKAIQEKVESKVTELNENLVILKNLEIESKLQIERIDTLQNELAEAITTWQKHKARADYSDLIFEKNSLVLFEGTPDYYYKTGVLSLTFIDDEGKPQLFYKDNEQSRIWLPENSGNRRNTIIEETENGSYILKCSNGEKREYDKNGLLKTIQNISGNGVFLTHDSNGRVIKITSTSDESFTLSYTSTSQNLLTSITNDTNSEIIVSYKYDGNLLSSVTDSDGDTVGFSYNNDGYLSCMTKPDGSTVKFDYGLKDANGNFLTTSTTNEEGKTEYFEYSPTERRTLYTDHSGVQTVYQFDENHRTRLMQKKNGDTTEYEYNEFGDITALSFNGNRTSYKYDKTGNMIEAIYSDGSSEKWQYDNLNLIIFYKDRDGIITTYSRDNRGNITAMIIGGNTNYTATYDEKSQIKTFTTYVNNTFAVTESYFYDERGNLIKCIKPDNNVAGTSYSTETWTYDTQNRPVSYSLNGKVLTTYKYEKKTVTIKMNNGLESTINYNNRKDIAEIVQTDTVTGEKRTTSYTYDKRHKLIKVAQTGDAKTGNVQTGNIQTGDVQDGVAVIEYRYYPAGEIEAEIYRNITDISGKQSSSGSTECWITRYRYDAAGRLASRKIFKTSCSLTDDFQKMDLDGLEKSAGKNLFEESLVTSSINKGQSVAYSDNLGRKTTILYDAWGNIKSTTNNLGVTNTNEYSPAGRLRKMQSVYGGFYEYTVDNAGNTVVEEAGKQKAYVSYNSDGTIASITNSLGETTEYEYAVTGLVRCIRSVSSTQWRSYDSQGRLTRILYGQTDDEESSERFTTYSYSNDGRTVSECQGGLYITHYTLNAWGDITKKTDGVGNTYKREYNKAGLVTAEYDGYNNKTCYEYNAINQVSSVLNPDGSKITYEYNHLGLVTKITDSEGISWSGTYDCAGRLTSETGRPGINKSYSYDTLDRLIEIRNDGQIIESLSYDERGNRVTRTDGNGNSRVYEFDSYGQFKSETNTENITFKQNNSVTMFTDVNSCGTIKSESVLGTIKYTYNKAGRLVTQNDLQNGITVTYYYDKAGRRTSLKTNNRDISYKYGANGELLEICDSNLGLSVLFEYDKMGREVSRTSGNGVIQRTFYDKAGRPILIAEYSSNGQLIRGEGYIFDALGRRRATVDNNALVTLYDYDAQSRLLAVYYPNSTAFATTLRSEAAENGLTFLESTSVATEKWLTITEQQSLASLMSQMQYSLGNSLAYSHLLIKESYSYDKAGNRISKTTPFGTIEYTYDTENRLVSSGTTGLLDAVKYSYDASGNLLSRSSSYSTTEYEYDDNNRMIYSRVINVLAKTVTTTKYAYDAFGRRTLVQDQGSLAIRTVYDGFSFDVLSETPVYTTMLFDDTPVTKSDNSFDSYANTTYKSEFYNSNEQVNQSLSSSDNGTPTGERYRFINDTANNTNSDTASSINGITTSSTNRQQDTQSNVSSSRYRHIDEGDYRVVSGRYIQTTSPLNAYGTTIAVSFGDSSNSDNSFYLGTDILGSVCSVTGHTGFQEASLNYDAFGTPVNAANYGDSSGNDYNSATSHLSSSVLQVAGYTGKGYDASTGLYDYGFRDYSPLSARFTTLDPIRDGSNWYNYTTSDPVNYVDLLGLKIGQYTTHNRMNDNTWGNEITGNGKENKTLSSIGCAITVMSNLLSSYTQLNISPLLINNDKSNFLEGTDNLLMQKLGEKYGLIFDYWTTKSDITSILKNNQASEKEYYVAALVKYNNDGGEHWVSITEIIEENGKSYAKIEGSSKFDTNKLLRVRDSWILKDSTMYVETTDIVKIYTYEVKKNK